MPAVSFEGACALLETALDGAARREIVAALSDAKDCAHSLRRLRGGMRDHVWKIGDRRIDLAEVVPSTTPDAAGRLPRPARLGRQGRPRQRRHDPGRRAGLPRRGAAASRRTPRRSPSSSTTTSAPAGAALAAHLGRRRCRRESRPPECPAARCRARTAAASASPTTPRR